MLAGMAACPQPMSVLGRPVRPPGRSGPAGLTCLLGTGSGRQGLQGIEACPSPAMAAALGTWNLAAGQRRPWSSAVHSPVNYPSLPICSQRVHPTALRRQPVSCSPAPHSCHPVRPPPGRGLGCGAPVVSTSAPGTLADAVGPGLGVLGWWRTGSGRDGSRTP